MPLYNPENNACYFRISVSDRSGNRNQRPSGQAAENARDRGVQPRTDNHDTVPVDLGKPLLEPPEPCHAAVLKVFVSYPEILKRAAGFVRNKGVRGSGRDNSNRSVFLPPLRQPFAIRRTGNRVVAVTPADVFGESFQGFGAQSRKKNRMPASASESQQQLLQALGILPLTEHRLRQTYPRVSRFIKQNSFTHRLKIRPHGGAPTWGQSRFYA